MTDPIAELSMQKGPLVPEAIRLKLKAVNDKGTIIRYAGRSAVLNCNGFFLGIDGGVIESQDWE